MKSYRKELWFNLPERMAFINITGDVEECLRESRVQEGLVLVNAMHIDLLRSQPDKGRGRDRRRPVRPVLQG